MNRSLRTLFILFSIALLAACNSNDGGPCDYEFHRVEAQVKDIAPYQANEYPQGHDKADTLYHVVMDFNASSLAAEDQYLEQLKEVNINKDFLTRHKIQIGNIYMGDVSERTSGNCQPLFVSFDVGLSR